MEKKSGLRNQISGSLFVLVGAILFSTKAVLVKLGYRFEIDSLSLLALRMLFALPVYLAIGFWANQKISKTPISRKDLLTTFSLGAAGYYVASLCDFVGLQYISAGMERIILFLYPTLVVIISAAFFRQKITPVIFAALVLSYVGISLAFLDNNVASDRPHFYFGAGMVFIAALTYAIYIIGSGQLLPRIGTLRFTSIGMSVAAACVLAHHAVAQGLQLWHYPSELYLIAFTMALLATILPSFLISEGIRRIGATNASIIGSIGPISTIILAYIFLDEGFGWWQMGGTVLVIAGVVIISVSKEDH